MSLTENSFAIGVALEAGVDFARVGAATWEHEQVKETNAAKKNVTVSERVSVISEVSG